MNGIELAHLIKQRKRNQHIPIIFLTAYFHEDKDVLQGYEVGAVDYLTKPVRSADSQVEGRRLRRSVSQDARPGRRQSGDGTGNRATPKAELALRQSNSQLEARVEQRTAELTQANEELGLSEASQRASQQRLNQILALMPAGVYTCDAEGFISFYNEAAAEFVGTKSRTRQRSMVRLSPDFSRRRHAVAAGPMPDGPRGPRKAGRFGARRSSSNGPTAPAAMCCRTRNRFATRPAR